MGKLTVIKSAPLASIQDRGRIGHRRHAIPQSGAMDFALMCQANRGVGNPDEAPVVEFALMGMRLAAQEETFVAFAGCTAQVNDQACTQPSMLLQPGDVLVLSAPKKVYGYLAVRGALELSPVLGSFSTYLPGGFGGYKGRCLQQGDVLKTLEDNAPTERSMPIIESSAPPSSIRFTEGPEWDHITEKWDTKSFQISPASNRVGIRLVGTPLDCRISEIASSAVIPGTMQLPADGLPLLLMNDCQTTGGYPRIGTILPEDLGTLAQIRPGERVTLFRV